ncbi:MAG TPA: DUF4349 domain-containing protein [Solirubrobacteraceae bacterium]|nr:DUF4349 domain-containing protein [Solirubrobacteraceae bacterium]
MKRLDDTPIDPEVAASLDAIDATLAGEPVDPRYAELAELALLLRAERPQCGAQFVHAMDVHVERRFARPAAAGAGGAGGGPPAKPRGRRMWALAPVWGGGAVAAAIAIAIVLSAGGSGSSTPNLPLRAAIRGVSTASTGTPVPAQGAVASSAGSASSTPAHAPSKAGAFGAIGATPPSTGRKLIQSSQLALQTPAGRIDTVAQELFNVVGDEGGFVNRSSVTAGSTPAAYAQFQLSIPSGNLPQTMAQLSRLRYASVGSRTDNTQDVNNQYVGDQRALAQAQALRTALLKQLASAATQQQIDSLQAQLRDANRQIASDEAAVRTLNHAIDYSQVNVTINPATPAPVTHKGFTIGKAAHDAGRVLTVAAGVALIALAVIVPLSLLAALGWWAASAVRRRRREQALDLA